MKLKILLISALLFAFLTGGCSDDEPRVIPGMPEIPGLGVDEEYGELPEPLVQENYSPSLIGKPYFPIMVKYSNADGKPSSWTNVKTRILPYMIGFESDNSYAKYSELVNKWGSRTDVPTQSVTGRFHTKKVNGRWWIIDPEGNLHLEKGINSVVPGSSERNKTAWNEKYGTISKWLSTLRDELHSLGIHGTGAFCSTTYGDIQEYNAQNGGAPLTLTPSFAFLSRFKTDAGISNPGNLSTNAVGVVFDSRWEQFCVDYCAGEALRPYLRDRNVIGIFSDNEIDFSSASSKILSRFLALKNEAIPAYTAARTFMESKGLTSTSPVNDNLNDEFSGIVADKYYKGVKEGLKKADDGMMYLGSRLHGTPKYLNGVITAAGKHCDIISINYYSRWSPELDSWVAKWDELSPNAPFLVTEFYTKGDDTDMPNSSGAGFTVPTQLDRACAYQHFTLGLLEAKNCVGWHWFRYLDDDGIANKGLYDNHYVVHKELGTYMRFLNFNSYRLIDFFDE